MAKFGRSSFSGSSRWPEGEYGSSGPSSGITAAAEKLSGIADALSSTNEEGIGVIVAELRRTHGPLRVGGLAEGMGWQPGKLADTLIEAGRRGLIEFGKTADGETSITLGPEAVK